MRPGRNLTRKFALSIDIISPQLQAGPPGLQYTNGYLNVYYRFQLKRTKWGHHDRLISRKRQLWRIPTCATVSHRWALYKSKTFLSPTIAHANGCVWTKCICRWEINGSKARVRQIECVFVGTLWAQKLPKRVTVSKCTFVTVRQPFQTVYEHGK